MRLCVTLALLLSSVAAAQAPPTLDIPKNIKPYVLGLLVQEKPDPT